MKKILLIRMPPSTSGIDEGTVVQWGLFTGSGDLSGDVHVTRMENLKEEWYKLLQTDSGGGEKVDHQPDKVVLLLPGNLVLHRYLDVSSAQQKHINSVLPYMIEEELAEDIESMHVASYLHRKENSASLFAVSHATMQSVLSCFGAHDIVLDNIYAECQFFHAEKNTASMLLDSSMVIMATPARAALTVDYEAIPFALEQRVSAFEQGETDFGDQEEERISQVQLIFSEGIFPTPEDKISMIRNWLTENGWLVQEEKREGSVFEYFAASYFAERRATSLVDLRSGPYQCPRKASRKMRQWRPLIALVACWLIIEVGLMISQGLYFGHQADKLWQQNADNYLAAFPQDRQVKDARQRHQRTFDLQKWLENRLKHLGQSPTGEPFLPLLLKVSSITAAQGEEAGIISQGMDFNNASGYLVFEFQASSLEVVNKLMAALQSEGLQTRLDSANQEKSGVLARMTVAR